MPFNSNDPNDPHNPFDDFINHSLDLSGEDSGPGMHDYGKDTLAWGDEMAERVRRETMAALDAMDLPNMEGWLNDLDEIRATIRSEILKHVRPSFEETGKLTREELVVQMGIIYMTLAWRVYDQVCDALFGNGLDGLEHFDEFNGGMKDDGDSEDDEDGGKTPG